MAEQAYLQFHDLDVGYGGKPLIREIGFSVGKGEICALIGPNGAGKSTILKTLLRMLPPVNGCVYLDGADVKNYSFADLSKAAAAVLTGRRDTELMTCRDVVEAGRYPYTGRLGILQKTDREKVEEAFHVMRAAHLAEKDFNACSDGEKQRVLIARALCQEPSLLILDEPTSYLDIRYKLELMEVLRQKASEEGLAVLTSLHEVELALRYADRIVCVRGDSVFFEGTPKALAESDCLQELYELDDDAFDMMFGDLLRRIRTGSAERTNRT